MGPIIRSDSGSGDTLRALETAKVDLYLDQQAIDTATPAGRMFFHITGAFAAGNGMLKTATALGAGSGVVQRVKAGMLQRTEMPVRH